MSLARRFSLVTAVTVAIVLVVAALAAYLLTRSALLREVDRTLRELPPRGATVAWQDLSPVLAGFTPAPIGFAPAPIGFTQAPIGLTREPIGFTQASPALPAGSLVASATPGAFVEIVDGTAGPDAGGPSSAFPDDARVDAFVFTAVGALTGWQVRVVGTAPVAHLQPSLFPVDARVSAVLAGETAEDIRTISLDGDDYRVITQSGSPLPAGQAVQIARPLEETNRVLSRLVWILAGICAGGALVAGLGAGRLARAVLAPVRRMAAATEHVSRTRDLRRRVPDGGRDELATLARSFNTMLGALDESLRSQRQLVVDASHELRTPLASVRTNVDLLQRRGLSERERREALADVSAQVDELTGIVADIVELARSGGESAPIDDVRLDAIAAEVVERMRLHAPHVELRLQGRPCLVRGAPDRLARAVRNLVDNAVKWSSPGAAVDVTVGQGEVTVRDRGPGIDPEHVTLAFDRFWRAPGSRGLPGSGLGLAIVRQVATDYGGEASLEPAPGGGTLARLAFPWRPPDGDEAEALAADASANDVSASRELSGCVPGRTER